jgi:hypothetical protein
LKQLEQARNAWSVMEELKGQLKALSEHVASIMVRL